MRVIQCFMNVNMGNGHDGLKAIARRGANINADEMGPGEYLVFINRKREKIKVLCTGGEGTQKTLVFAYARYKHAIDLNAIQFIPHAFQGGNFNFDRALQLALETA